MKTTWPKIKLITNQVVTNLMAKKKLKKYI